MVRVRLFSALLLFQSSRASCYTTYVYCNQMACIRVDAVAVIVTMLASSRPSESLLLTCLLEWVSSKALLWSRGSISAFSLLFQAELSLYKPHDSGFPAFCCPARLWRRRSLRRRAFFFLFSSPCVPSFLPEAMCGLSTAASIWGEHHLDLSWW